LIRNTVAPWSFKDRLEAIWRRSAQRGEPLPNEEHLASELNVGRPRLREALAQLEQAGIVQRSQGAPTVANPAALDLDCRLEYRKPFDIVIRDAGFEPRREILGTDLVQLDDEEARVLHASVGTDALRIVKRWLADGVPARLAVDVLPLSNVESRPEVDPSLPVAELAELLNGETVVWELIIPIAARATRRIGEQLELARGTGLVCLDSVGITRSGRRVYRCADYYTGVIRMGIMRTMATARPPLEDLQHADDPGRESRSGEQSPA
jgi:DNA-binding GntR family transcriptional regulator